ncbi:hypothetical protein [Reinekea sp.]|jgi:hypothetical protein|uniref:hypothetical protein n=1 Tax=Reinekea sp. TaxID=1970455 RepID=UPI002A833831|nr:hypothetical protein [Reinekea sp.]
MKRACPIVYRESAIGLEVLAFSQPTAGKQLVTGIIGAKETLAASCVRSLRQASGLQGKAKRYIGKELMATAEATFGFYLMDTESISAEQWQWPENATEGEPLDFFWQRLDQPLGDEWQPLYRELSAFIHQHFNSPAA